MAIEVEVEIGADASPADTAAKQVSMLRDQVMQLQQQVNQMQSAVQGGMQSVDQMGNSTGEAGANLGSLRQDLAAATDGISEFVILIGEAIGAVGEFAVGVADLVQKLGLLHDQIATAGGEKLVGVVDTLSQKLPETKDQIGALAVKLTEMGMSADQVQKAITAMSAANAESAGSGDKLLNVIEKMQMGAKLGKRDFMALAQITGMSVKQIQAELSKGGAAADAFMAKIEDMATAKGAKVLSDKMQDLGVIWDKFKERVLDLFTGIANSPGYKEFIAAVNTLFHLFDSQADKMKGGFTSAMSTMFSVAAKTLTYIEIALLKVATFGVRAYIWAFPFIKKVKELWREFGMSDKVITALKALGVIIGVLLVGAATTLITTLGIMTATILAVAYAGEKLWVAIIGIATYIYKLIVAAWAFVKSAGKAITDWIDGAVSAGEDFVKGIVEGIKNGAQWVYDAVANLGSGMVDGLKSVLGISSPSKVMMKMGGHTAEGFVQGVDAKQNDVIASAEGIADAAQSGAAPSGGGGRGGGGVTVNINAGAIVINAKGGSDSSIREMAEQLLVEINERVMHAQGLGAT